MCDAEAGYFAGSCPVVYHTVHVFYSGISKLWYKAVTGVAPAREFRVKKKNINKQTRKHDVTQASFCRFPLNLFLFRIINVILSLTR